MKSLKFSYFSLYLSDFLQFFEKFLQKSLELIKKYLPLQSQTKRMGHKRGSSSVGRAQPCQGWGREFEPRLPLQKQMKSAEMLTLNYEKISPDGVQLYVSRPCAQGRLFYFTHNSLGHRHLKQQGSENLPTLVELTCFVSGI